MREWVRDQNIKLFSAKLAGDLSSSQRVTIEALLTQELAGGGDEPSGAPAGNVAGIDPLKAEACSIKTQTITERQKPDHRSLV
jgi:hypothetical protein